jgi:DNA-directed RNA polymerase subunit RPC12/RpoP
VTASEAAGHNRCPGCGKAMIVVKPPSGKTVVGQRLVSLSAPPPAPATPARSDGSEPRLIKITPGTQNVDCVCGEKIFVRGEQIGQMISCPGCSRKIRVEMKDKSSASFPRVVPGSRTPTPPPGFTCECGQALEISKALDSRGTVCTGCGRTITMEKVRGPQTKHTIIRPRFGPKGGPPSAPSAPPPGAADGILEMPPVEFSEEDAPAPVARQSRAQPVFCPCGEALMVGQESVGRNIQCPTCMILIAVDQIRDSTSGNFVLRVRAIGKMDQDTWSLNDFS